jgi:hypothetical protein
MPDAARIAAYDRVATEVTFTNRRTSSMAVAGYESVALLAKRLLGSRSSQV